MSAAPHALAAESAANRLRVRLATEFGYEASSHAAVDVHLIADTFCDCVLVHMESLTDRRATEHLSGIGMDAGDTVPSDAPLAGALYASEDGRFRWIFYESADPEVRQRFSIAHELGHLLLDVEPALQSDALVEIPGLLEPRRRIVRHSRCSAPDSQPAATRRGWTAAELREIRANHFAAELLMPLSGVRAHLSQMFGLTGVRSDVELERLAGHIAHTYNVSLASARLRLSKDLRVVPTTRDPNRDLFG